MFRVHGKGIGFARASIMGLWFSSCVREILIPINFLLKKILETVENSNKMCRIFAFYYFALLRLGAKMLMIKNKIPCEENTLQRGWNKIVFEAL